jgi:hypothetical protein
VFSNPQRLFNDRVIAYALQEQQEAMNEMASAFSAADIEDEEGALRKLEHVGEYRVARLELEKTTFHTHESGDTLTITAEIPFTGYRGSFYVTPVEVGVPVLEAHIDHNHLALTDKFPRLTDPADIKSSFRVEADRIQETLDHISSQVQKFNDDVPRRAKAALDARRGKDAERQTLREGLEGGL